MQHVKFYLPEQNNSRLTTKTVHDLFPFYSSAKILIHLTLVELPTKTNK